jgi:peptide/nickel transport system ATP-binding protein
LLAVDDIAVRFKTARGTVRAVDGVSLSIRPGETLGLVGESGCGKSTLGRAIARLVEPETGSVRLGGVDLTRMSRRQLRVHRSDVQMVFQDPLASLDPRWTVGSLIAEPLNIHSIGSRAERRDRVADLLAKVGLPTDAAGRYPHQFSGGQRQRIGILNLLVDLQKQLGVAYLFISHDLSVVEYISDRVAVMYLGRIVEIAIREQLWSSPAHPYTQALFASIPRIDAAGASRHGPPLKGDLPSPYAPPSGCRFHTRCAMAQPRCRVVSPALAPVPGKGHAAACHFPTFASD